jgi:hypothetical protein
MAELKAIYLNMPRICRAVYKLFHWINFHKEPVGHLSFFLHNLIVDNCVSLFYCIMKQSPNSAIETTFIVICGLPGTLGVLAEPVWAAYFGLWSQNIPPALCRDGTVGSNWISSAPPVSCPPSFLCTSS